MRHLGWRVAFPASLVVVLFAVAAAVSPVATAQTAEDEGRWAELAEIYFPDQTIVDRPDLLTMEAPYRAHDAAIVPIRVTATFPQSEELSVERLWLLVDDNPVPMVGKFEFGDDITAVDLTTRVRVNEYTYIHAVAELSDGSSIMTRSYVKAAGGCSAPAMKDPEVAASRLGSMRFNLPETIVAQTPVNAQLLISHPNNTGMQFDQISRNYVPPHYVRTVRVSYGGQRVLDIEADISMSEDPSFHFSFLPEGEGVIEVEVLDSEENIFSGSWTVKPAPAT
ncbi:MAG: quinoprotein dehydrogenase-associated SoxYZ-like carrier [Inquilinus sp.]|nr:quinoprotein dehydrogenase-associated SoxYZ-like carrier [Inquilinus sp.]